MSKTILTIDDSASIRQMVGLTLTAAGYTVLEAVDGADGYAKATANTVDAVITDLNMPVMNGIEFICELRRKSGGAKPKVVFCTTENDVAHIREAIEAGADEYVMKPFDHDTLQMKLQLIGAA